MSSKILKKYAFWKPAKTETFKFADSVCGGGECGASACSTSCSGSGCGWGN